ncbi:hypothetical protein [Bacterioplanoides sp.]|uniref:hypothetical protein n=1 Tax=Bacterioplanoides sp. TaxID=2066072 RepID=UPI003B00E512
MSEVQEIRKPPGFDFIIEAFLGSPAQTQIGMVMFAATWLIGGNILFYFSMKRRDIPYWKIIIPSFITIFDLNGREWLILAGLAITSLSFALWGSSAQNV